ncbi:MAG: transglutaminase family protein [Rhodospirillaceae bacterium]|nr:transglutaminase family protein [Rhodospirillaceae bacterium]
MRIHVRHVTTYTYDTPAHSITQLLRLTPRNHQGQTVRKWRIDLDCDGQLKASEDAFGNTVHTLSLAGPVGALTVAADGELDTLDTNGIVRGAVERFPVGLYLRETDLTKPSAELIEYAKALEGPDILTTLHNVLARIYRDMRFDKTPTQATTTAAEAFALKSGVCQDLTHIFLACARTLKIPARYVGGYLWRADGDARQQQEAGHAWAEAYVPDLGWVGFDPANGISAMAAHVRVAIGLDYLGAAPVRGSRTGGPGERLDVAVSIAQNQ